MRLLVVDDDPDSRRLLEWFLRQAGYADVHVAASAAAAFVYLGIEHDEGRRRAGAQRVEGRPDDGVDLILLDIDMPELDGIAACRRLKATEWLHDVPVIMVTGNTAGEDVEQAFAAGAVDYVTKPVRKVELLARVRSALRLQQEMARRKSREHELLELTQRLAAANAELGRLAALDGLTGISNRRHFDSALRTEWRRAAREGTWLSLLVADIDYFKAYNDTHGHQAGDACLRQVAQVMAGTVRRPADFAARYGGEEFVLLIPDTSLAGAATVAERLRNDIEALRLTHGASLASAWVTTSVGVAAALPSATSSPAALFSAADQALYAAKQQGRNRVVRATCAETLR